MPGLYFFLKQGPEKCWVTFRLCPVAGALLQLDIVVACITQVVCALLPLLAGWELTEIPVGTPSFNSAMRHESGSLQCDANA